MTPVESSDERIKKKVVDHLYWSTRVDASDVNVSVDESEVTLSGEVGSVRMKQDIENLTMEVSGVHGLENNLDVVLEGSLEVPSDEEIRRRVEEVLTWDVDIDESHIEVRVSNGVVTLKGSVDDKWKVTYTLSKAEELEGVIDVANELSVVPTMDVEDETIAHELMDAFERNGSIDPDPLEVRVENGEVYLQGSVASARQEAEVYETALQTPGVKRVIDNTTVRPSRAASRGV